MARQGAAERAPCQSEVCNRLSTGCEPRSLKTGGYQIFSPDTPPGSTNGARKLCRQEPRNNFRPHRKQMSRVVEPRKFPRPEAAVRSKKNKCQGARTVASLPERIQDPRLRPTRTRPLLGLRAWVQFQELG